MIGRLVAFLLLVTAIVALSPAASAKTAGVGDCRSSCAALCYGDCAGGDACAGIGDQVPQCVDTPLGGSTGPALRCLPDFCTVINAVCEKVLRVECLA
jgi:hypothetical protein